MEVNMILDYIGLIEYHQNEYYIFFPDVPGITACGKTLAEAKKLAKKFLVEGLLDHLAQKVKLPKPGSLDDILNNPDYKHCTPIVISVAEPSGKAIRINITMHQSVLHIIDHEAKLQNKSRSSLIEEILLKSYAA
jgi:predicted RNase H-like HicB family nuclease